MHEEVVTIPTPDGSMRAFLARPEDGDHPRPAVLVVQEAYGVNDHIRDVCRRFAGQGYVALAPQLFHRDGPDIEVPYTNLPAAMHHLASLTNDGLERDLRAGLEQLRSRPEVAPAQVGLVGFCVGGFAALLGACRLDPAATVSFYGGGIVRPRPQFALRPVLEEAGRIQAPILCFFGERDQGIPPDDVEAVRLALEPLSVPHEVQVYPGAGHAFFCNERPSYQAEAAEDSWRRTLDWFGRHLQAAAITPAW